MMGKQGIEVYQRYGLRGKRWYWRAESGNNRIVADGSEGYVNRLDAYQGIAVTWKIFGAGEMPAIYENGIRMDIHGLPYSAEPEHVASDFAPQKPVTGRTESRKPARANRPKKR